MTLKPYLKKLLKSSACTRAASWIAARYMGFVLKTNAWQRIGEEIPRKYWKDNKPFVVCFWHGRLAMLAFAWRHTSPFYMLISAHRDGKVIAKGVGYHGIKTIAGSTSRGGTQALRSILNILKSGHTIGITPDGPRGPRFKVNPGLIAIARMAKVDLVPVTFSTRKRIIWNSWDRLVFPLPFGRGVFAWGQPILYDQLKNKDAVGKISAELEQRLNDLNNHADALCGHAPLEPGNVKSENSTCSS